MRLLVVLAMAVLIALALWLAPAERRALTRQEAEEIASRALARYGEARHRDRRHFSGPTLLEDDPVCAWMFRYEWSATPPERVFVCVDHLGNAELSLQEEPPSGT
jgi:hypothetical protein